MPGQLEWQVARPPPDRVVARKGGDGPEAPATVF